MPRGRAARCLTLMVVALAAACGTVWSVHPLFSDDDLVFEPRLLATWIDVARPDGDRWLLVRTDTASRRYLLAVADSGHAAALSGVDFGILLESDSASRARLERDPSARARRARDSVTVSGMRSDGGGPRFFWALLGRLDGTLFADLSPADIADSTPHLGKSLMIPAHWFWKISLDGDRLRASPLNDDWLSKKIDSGKVRIAHEKENGDYILTAPSGALQRLVRQYARDTLAFPRKKEAVFRRQR